MTLRASAVSPELRAKLPEQIRGQVGSMAYQSLVVRLGTDAIIDAMLAQAPSGQVRSARPPLGRRASTMADAVFGAVNGLDYLPPKGA